MKHKRSILLIIAALALTPAMAQVQIDKSVTTTADGEVGVENPFGSVTVIGWEQNEVKVTGSLAAGAEGLDIDSEEAGEGEGGEVWVSIEVPDSWFYDDEDAGEFVSDITVHVPHGSLVEVETVNGAVTVSGVDGGVYVEAVNGDVKVSGDPREIEVEAMTGNVEIDAGNAEISVEAVSGNVDITGAGGSVEVEAVAGTIRIDGDAMHEMSIESVNGSVELRGTLANEGWIGVETVAGNVDLMLGPGAKARFELATFSGEIQNSIGPKPRKADPHMPGKSLNFATGDNDFEISVETFSGNITVGGS